MRRMSNLEYKCRLTSPSTSVTFTQLNFVSKTLSTTPLEWKRFWRKPKNWQSSHTKAQLLPRSWKERQKNRTFPSEKLPTPQTLDGAADWKTCPQFSTCKSHLSLWQAQKKTGKGTILHRGNGNLSAELWLFWSRWKTLSKLSRVKRSRQWTGCWRGSTPCTACWMSLLPTLAIAELGLDESCGGRLKRDFRRKAPPNHCHAWPTILHLTLKASIWRNRTKWNRRKIWLSRSGTRCSFGMRASSVVLGSSLRRRRKRLSCRQPQSWGKKCRQKGLQDHPAGTNSSGLITSVQSERKWSSMKLWPWRGKKRRFWTGGKLMRQCSQSWQRWPKRFWPCQPHQQRARGCSAQVRHSHHHHHHLHHHHLRCRRCRQHRHHHRCRVAVIIIIIIVRRQFCHEKAVVSGP